MSDETWLSIISYVIFLTVLARSLEPSMSVDPRYCSICLVNASVSGAYAFFAFS